MLRHRIALVGLAMVGMAVSCKKSPAPGVVEFDQRWSDLARAGVEVSYIEDDRGEGLMGNVRRASAVKAEPAAVAPAAPADNPSALPEQLPGEQVQRIIRSNLMGVRGCFMRMARAGQTRSGKAIVSFSIDADGRTTGLRVDAPSFIDTSLPGCVTAQISHWEFPKSQKGTGPVSYPFVFVGS